MGITERRVETSGEIARRMRPVMTVAASVAAFLVGFYLRMNAAYGPFNLGFHPAEWMVLWELFIYGQMSTRILLESVLAGLVAGAVPWLLVGVMRRVG